MSLSTFTSVKSRADFDWGKRSVKKFTQFLWQLFKQISLTQGQLVCPRAAVFLSAHSPCKIKSNDHYDESVLIKIRKCFHGTSSKTYNVGFSCSWAWLSVASGLKEMNVISFSFLSNGTIRKDFLHFSRLIMLLLFNFVSKINDRH